MSGPGRKKGARWVGRLLISLIVGVSTILIIIFLSGSSEVLARLLSSNLYTLSLLFLASSLVIVIDSLRTYILLKSLGKTFKFSVAVENSIFGFFVSALTPFSAGGQPFQIWHLTRYGIGVEEASMVVGLKFLTSFSITVIWGLAAMGFYFEIIKSIKVLGKFMLLGILLTIAMYAFFLLLLLNSRFIKAVLCSPVISAPIAFLLRKRREEILTTIDEKVKSYKTLLRKFWRKSKSCFFINILLTFIMILSVLSTSYLSILTVSNHEIPYLKILGLQIAVNMIVYFTPTPGASGGMEGVFYLVFSKVVSKSDVAAGLILWRFFTYYLVIIIGNLTSVRYMFKSVSGSDLSSHL